MKKIVLNLLILLLSGFIIKADPVTVSGKVINGNGITIRLMAYKDQVSYLRETLQSSPIGEEGRFSFTIDIDSVKYCWLDIEFQQAEIFLQPGQTYDVEIELKNDPLSASYYNRTSLPFRVIKDDEDRLNLNIEDFNQLYNDFLLNYSQKIRSGSSKSVFDNFIKAIDLRFQNATNPFFLDYIKYKTASMQLFMRLRSRDNIGLDYLSDQPVLYDHLEYMDFFHLYFEKYFLTSGKFFNYNKTYDLINGTAGFPDIMDSLKADPVLQNARLRELLLLDGLKELYNVSGFKRTRIISLVSEIKMNGNAAESRKLAENLLTRLKRLQPGTPAPEFALTGVTDKLEHRLSDFAGEKVYLAFFNSQNPASQSEMGMIREIYDEYRNKVSFVAVSVDKDLHALREYLKIAGLPWIVLHFGGDMELLEKYDASTYPYFVLINDKGQITRCPAPSPSENIRRLFD